MVGGQQGLRRLRGTRHRLPQQQHHGHRDRRPARGHVRHLRRHALQRRLLLRLRQRRDATAATTATAPWRPSTSATSRSGATARATARGSWPTWRTACSPASTPRYNANDPTINHRFLTAIIKGEPNHWAIRGGNAQSGGLSTFYNGARPNVAGYNPMKKEGAIILGIGGDNSIGAAGTFYEGVMTSGYPSDATENAVQANITTAGYARTERRRAERPDRGRPVRPVRGRAQQHHHQRHPGAAVGLQRRHQPAVDLHLQQAAAGVRQQVPGRQRPGHHQRHRGRSSGTATARPTSSGTSTPTAPSPASSPGCAWTPTAPPRPTARSSSCGPATAAPTSSGACAAEPRAAGAARTPPWPPRSGTSRWAAPGRAEVRTRLRSATPSDPHT